MDKIFAALGSKIVNTARKLSKTKRPSTQPRSLYIDCTYIYSTNINTGIQRVVRNIIKHIKVHTNDKSIRLVTAALVNGAFIEIDPNELESFQKKSKLASITQRIIRKVTLYFKSFLAGEKIYENDIVLMLDSSWHLHVWDSVEYAKGSGAKIVGVTYDLIPVTHPQFCDDVMEFYFTDWYQKSINYFDGYICISKTVMESLVEYINSIDRTGHHFSFDHFTLGADIDTKERQNNTIRESLQKLYYNSASIYLTVSTIEPRKNHRFVYEAFKKLWQNGYDIVWVIVGGSGWKTQELQKEMRNDKAFQDKLWIFNDLGDSELHYCYRNSKALIFPSIIEGYGLPIVESLKNGLPVLASDIPIHREVGGENILYFDISESDSLVSLMKAVEEGKIPLKHTESENINIPNWNESAKDLLEKTVKISGDKN